MSRNRVNGKTPGIARFVGREDNDRRLVDDPPHTGGGIRLDLKIRRYLKRTRKEIDYGEVFNSGATK